MVDQDLIIIGHISRPHGVSGEIRVRSYTESPTAFDKWPKLFVRRPGQAPVPYEVITARPHQRTVLLKLKNVISRSQAEALAGAEVLVRRTWLPEPAPDEYYWTDLMGLMVEDLSGHPMGQVSNVMSVGEDELLVITRQNQELLLPFRAEMVSEIDLTNNRLVVDPPEGLWDLETR